MTNTIYKPAPPVEELRDLHVNQRLSNAAIAKRYGVTRPTVANWLQNAGIRKIAHHVPMPSQAELQALYDTPLSQYKIAAHYGVSWMTVRRWFSELDIEARLPGGSVKVDQTSPDYEFIGATDEPADPELAHTPDPMPKPRRTTHRPFLRLSEKERQLVSRAVDTFLIWVAIQKESAC